MRYLETVRVPIIPTCHPDRPHGGRGLCKSCYVIGRRDGWPAGAPPLNNAKRPLCHPDRAYYASDRCEPCFEAWRAETPADERTARSREYFRNHHCLKKFGMTAQERDALVSRQGGKCAICAEPDSRGKPLHIDHDHATGRIRGALCFRCNQALGYMRDRPDLLTKAAGYLLAYMAPEHVGLS